MAQLVVRALEAIVVRRLRSRAASNGRSAEEEHRQILRAALAPVRVKPTFKQHLLSMPDVGSDADFRRRREMPRRVRF